MTATLTQPRSRALTASRPLGRAGRAPLAAGRALSGVATALLTGVGLGVVALLWALEAGAERSADWDGAAEAEPDAAPLWVE